jgi:excisionase family DNA binding protein
MTQQPNETPTLLTLKEAIARLRISERTMHNLLNSGEIEGLFIVNRWKFTEEQLQNYLEASKPKNGKGAKKKRAYHRKQDN